MRIIAGEKRGLALMTTSRQQFRPTLGRVKESLFGILTPVMAGAKVLDLFAGSGALGLEALSRGAEAALFVDNDRTAVKMINENIRRSNYGDRCRVHNGDFRDIGEKIACGEQFDLIFADPPYHESYPEQVLAHVVTAALLPSEAILTLEMDKKEVPRALPGELKLLREKFYGATLIWILQRKL